MEANYLRELIQFFDGTLEAKLGLHGIGFEGGNHTDPSQRDNPPGAREARLQSNVTESCLMQIGDLKRLTLALYHSKQKVFVAPKEGDRDYEKLRNLFEKYDRVVLLTDEARKLGAKYAASARDDAERKAAQAGHVAHAKAWDKTASEWGRMVHEADGGRGTALGDPARWTLPASFADTREALRLVCLGKKPGKTDIVVRAQSQARLLVKRAEEAYYDAREKFDRLDLRKEIEKIHEANAWRL